jgi:hypothetical protein
MNKKEIKEALNDILSDWYYWDHIKEYLNNGTDFERLADFLEHDAKNNAEKLEKIINQL